MSPSANGDVVSGEVARQRVRPGGPVVLRRLRRLGTLPAALLGAPRLDGLAAPRLIGLGEPGRADDAIVAALERHGTDSATTTDERASAATAPLPRPRPPLPPPTSTDEPASTASLPRPRLPLPPPTTRRPAPRFDTAARRTGIDADGRSGPTADRAAPPFAAETRRAGSTPTDEIAPREPRGCQPPEPAPAWSPLAAIGATTPPYPPERETVTPALRRALGADSTGARAASRPRPIASGTRPEASPPWAEAAAGVPPAALRTVTSSPAARTTAPVVPPSGPASVPVEPARVRGLHGLVEAWNGASAAAGSGVPAVAASTSAATPTSGSSHEPREVTATGSDLDLIVAFGDALEVVLAGEAARHGIEVAR